MHALMVLHQIHMPNLFLNVFAILFIKKIDRSEKRQKYRQFEHLIELVLIINGISPG